MTREIGENDQGSFTFFQERGGATPQADFYG